MVGIKEKALRLGEELGQGEFGSVLKGTYRQPNGMMVDVAVKTLRVDAMGHGEKVGKDTEEHMPPTVVSSVH